MDILMSNPTTRVNTAGGLAAGTTTTLTLANNVNYEIKGKGYVKAAVSNTASPTTDANTGVAFTGVTINNGSVFAICLDSSGNVKAAQGSIQALDKSGNFINAPQFPAIPGTLCMIGYLVIKVASNGSTWTFGSSNMSGVTGVTYAFQDGNLPERPQVA